MAHDVNVMVSPIGPACTITPTDPWALMADASAVIREVPSASEVIRPSAETVAMLGAVDFHCTPAATVPSSLRATSWLLAPTRRIVAPSIDNAVAGGNGDEGVDDGAAGASPQPYKLMAARAISVS